MGNKPHSGVFNFYLFHTNYITSLQRTKSITILIFCISSIGMRSCPVVHCKIEFDELSHPACVEIGSRSMTMQEIRMHANIYFVRLMTCGKS